MIVPTDLLSSDAKPALVSDPDSADSAQESPGRLLVLLCTFNERDNLERLIPEIFAVVPQAELLVVDDGSPDGTGAYVASLAETDSRIRLIERAGKQGLGSAVIAGFRYAIDNAYERVLTLDADRSHPVRYLPALLELSQRVDVAIGSRYVPGGGVEGWGFTRTLMSWGINVYSRWFLGLPNRDNSGNFRCYRVARLAQLDFTRIRSTGYAFMEEILYRCRRIGCTFGETPIVFEDRVVGESKIDLKEVFSAFWIVFRLFLDRLFRVPVK